MKIQNLHQNLETSNRGMAKLNEKLVESKMTHEDEKKQMTKTFKSE